MTKLTCEVMSAFRDRAAASIWYICAKESLQTEEAFKRVVTKSQPQFACCGQTSRSIALTTFSALMKEIDYSSISEAFPYH